MGEVDPDAVARATIESAAAGLPADVAARVLAALRGPSASVPGGVPHATTQGADMAPLTGGAGPVRGRKSV